jgi:hypothetical protein
VRCLALIGLLVAFALVGCGDPTHESVEFTRADGSVAEFPTTLRAWCGPFDDENEDVEAVHVFAGELPRDESPASFWVVDAVRADVGRATSLPNDFVYTEPEGASLFAFDVEDRENELSSTTEESRGTIRVESGGCEPGDSLTVGFDDVVLGSEYSDLPTMSVSGSAEAEIGEPPSP